MNEDVNNRSLDVLCCLCEWMLGLFFSVEVSISFVFIAVELNREYENLRTGQKHKLLEFMSLSITHHLRKIMISVFTCLYIKETAQQYETI